MSINERLLLAVLAAPLIILAGLLWWNPTRAQGSPQWARVLFYIVAVSMWLAAIVPKL